MNIKSIAVLLFVFQFGFSQKLSHPLAAGPFQIKQESAFGDTLHILAILVQFQQDDDSRTTGDGTFDDSTANSPIIDAPPHDSSYFADHFLFAKNYFNKASNGQQHLSTTVLGKVITLSKNMEAYAPLDDNTPLVKMIQEAWTKADSANPGFPFQQYDLFVIFHAGSGRDIDLRSSLGYDPTPLDIPSLYFNIKSLQNVLGSDFDGIPVQNSSFKIKNTIVLPETEVRLIPSIQEDITLKLGMNGLMVASIASHLGLPDLFDTESGKTAIGRFGLMDGQAIFSFSGICPPEPSAWEKAYLGWLKPIEVTGTKSLVAPAVSLYETGMDTVYRVPISAKEYFLVENRQRDAKKNGQTVWMKWNGTVISKTFSTDEDYFYNANIDSIYGTVVDVDELDWGIPGVINANNNYHGGIVIWHIDESIIEKNLASNSINADPKHRGVYVEEADGSQDIGQTYDLTSSGYGSEDGSPIDYWFKGNISPVYTNEFSETSHPNSLSNSFAHSHVTMKNFSDSQPRMTFEVNVGDLLIQLVAQFKRHNLKLNNNDAPLAADLNGDGLPDLIYTDGDSIYAFKNDMTPFLNNSTGLFYPAGGKFQPSIINTIVGGDSAFIVGTDSSHQILFSTMDANNDGRADTIRTYSTSLPSTPVSFSKTNSSTPSVMQWGTVSGQTISAETGSNLVSIINTNTEPVIAVLENGSVIVKGNGIFSSSGETIVSYAVSPTSAVEINITSSSSVGTKFVLLRFSNNNIASVDLSAKSITYFGTDRALGALVAADVDGDGLSDVVVGGSDGVYAYNIKGILLEHFPLKTLDGGKVLGSPVVVRLANSGETAILFGSTNGHLYAYNANGTMLDGFPLQTGGMVSSPVLWGNELVAASTDTSVYVWNVGTMFDISKILWGNFMADIYHSNMTAITGTPVVRSSELLPKSLTYNWPNPVYGGKTNIRYYLGKSATVKIKILNMAGELVEELQGTNYAGLDNEVPWDVSKIQSGIYFAQITASGNGEDQSQIIKIAVVK